MYIYIETSFYNLCLDWSCRLCLGGSALFFLIRSSRKTWLVIQSNSKQINPKRKIFLYFIKRGKMQTALKHVVMCQLVGFKIQSTHERMVGLWWFGYQIASRAVDNRNEKRKPKTEQVRWIEQISGVLLAKPLSSCGHSIGQRLAQDGWSLVACIGSFAFNIFHRWQAAVYGLTFNYTIYMVD